MEQWTPEELDALRKLARRVHADPEWIEEDRMKLIREMVQTYEGVRAFGRFARMLIVTLAAIAAAVAAWDTIAAKVRIWFGG